jgi:hypothetical protein
VQLAQRRLVTQAPEKVHIEEKIFVRI